MQRARSHCHHLAFPPFFVFLFFFFLKNGGLKFYQISILSGTALEYKYLHSAVWPETLMVFPETYSCLWLVSWFWIYERWVVKRRRILKFFPSDFTLPVECVRVHLYCYSLSGYHTEHTHNRLRRKKPPPSRRDPVHLQQRAPILLTICWGRKKPLRAILKSRVHFQRPEELGSLAWVCILPSTAPDEFCGSSLTYHIWE